MGNYKTLNEMFFSINANAGNVPTFFTKDTNKKFHGVTFRDAYTQGERNGNKTFRILVSQKEF